MGGEKGEEVYYKILLAGVSSASPSSEQRKLTHDYFEGSTKLQVH